MFTLLFRNYRYEAYSGVEVSGGREWVKKTARLKKSSGSRVLHASLIRPLIRCGKPADNDMINDQSRREHYYLISKAADSNMLLVAYLRSD